MTQDFWKDDSPNQPPKVPDDVVDVLFSMSCRSLPVDHAEPLAQAILDLVPWMGSEPRCGIHSIHVAGSQNGWQRPDADGDQPLLISKRTKLGIRVPKGRVSELRAALENHQLDIAGNPLRLETGKERPLSRETTIFSRYVCSGTQHANDTDSESAFLEWAAAELGTLGIRVRKALCGKAAHLQTSAGPLPTRSLMLANLSFEESVRLQEQGLGPHRELGCGLFIPHKGIDAVGPTNG